MANETINFFFKFFWIKNSELGYHGICFTMKETEVLERFLHFLQIFLLVSGDYIEDLYTVFLPFICSILLSK